MDDSFKFELESLRGLEIYSTSWYLVERRKSTSPHTAIEWLPFVVLSRLPISCSPRLTHYNRMIMEWNGTLILLLLLYTYITFVTVRSLNHCLNLVEPMETKTCSHAQDIKF